jgi:hypothetical protein
MAISKDQIASFRDEIEKIAFDPVAAAGLMAAGKIMATNAISRHGASIPPVRWLAKEIAGVGARTALQGKPLLSRGLREAAAIGIDPKAVGLYEGAHAFAKRLGPDGFKLTKGLLGTNEARAIPEMAHARSFLDAVPLESKGIRKAVDYGFTPVGQVARDIKDKAKGLGHKVRQSLTKKKLPIVQGK